MPTTLGDYGRTSEKYGEIAFYYAFPIKLYFGNHQIKPDDVVTWCKENCQGYYKIVSYTHKSSKRNRRNPRKYDQQVVFVDKIYLSDNRDAVAIKLMWSVTKTYLQRPRIARLRLED
jgi:hypothetical protein